MHFYRTTFDVLHFAVGSSGYAVSDGTMVSK